MPPKVRITKQNIVAAAVGLVRTGGAEALNARALAQALHCSTQPIYSNFATMQALRQAVIDAAGALCAQYIAQETARGEYPAYKAAGMAYIRFAAEEPALFKLLYMRPRRDGSPAGEDALAARMTAQIRANTGISEDAAQRFHLEMWAFVHGIAAMYATGLMQPAQPLVSQMLTDIYQGLCLRFRQLSGPQADERKDENGSCH